MAAGAAISDVSSAHALITLETDGVLVVIEQIALRADGPTAATWQVTMQQGELFADPSLVVNGRRFRSGNGERAGTLRISRGTRGIRFDWRQPAGVGSARIGYRLALVGTAYTDVLDLRVPVWERDWPARVSRLTATLELQRPAPGRVIVWVEPDDLASTVTATAEDVRLRVTGVPADTGVTLRAVLPRKVLTSLRAVNVENKAGLQKILRERNGNSGPAWLTWAAAAALALAVSAAVAVGLRTGRWRRPRRR